MDNLDAQIADLSLRSGLGDVPLEIQKLIIRHLAIPGPLWTPRYTDSRFNNEGALSVKCQEYYGKGTSRARALLNWSTCSRHFRDLLVPEVFKTIVLRSKPKSMASIQTIQRSVIWSHIQELYFAGTWGKVRVSKDALKREGYLSKGEHISEKIKSEMAELTAILEHLPPNLSSLSLDFPQGWDNDYAIALFGGEGMIHTYGDFDYDVNRYDALVECILSAVSRNNISSKSAFQFKILGLVPLHLTQELKDQLAMFLCNVTSFTLGLCHYVGPHYWLGGESFSANSIDDFQAFSSKITPMFLNHLYKATSLHVHADDSWPLGLKCIDGVETDFGSKFPFPTDLRAMPNLSTVSFREFILSQELIDFLVLHKDTLESIELIECAAFVADSRGEDEIDPADETESSPPWSRLFEALATANPPKLCNFVVSTPCNSLNNLIQTRDDGSEVDSDAEQQQIKDIMKAQAEDLNNIADETDRELAERRFRRVLSYCSINLEYGTKENAARSNIKNFIAGRDHESWLRLVDIMEGNLARD